MFKRIEDEINSFLNKYCRRPEYILLGRKEYNSLLKEYNFYVWRTIRYNNITEKLYFDNIEIVEVLQENFLKVVG